MKKQHISLTDLDLEYLQGLLSKGTLKVRKQKRGQALLELNRGKTYTEVCTQLHVSYPTVWSWAQKYNSDGLGFLDDKPRSGRPVGISVEQRAKITSLACSNPPEGYARWSLRLLADRVVELGLVDHISHNHVGEILKKMNCSLTEKDNGPSAK
ncbi:MAG: helix-turn-helix domain-containing protein [Saprospiraceae bacterium]|nr:helix-turn-helix domain-containing protein [Saprospiraceae bacterium]